MNPTGFTVAAYSAGVYTTLLAIILSFFILIALGYLAKITKLLGASDAERLNKIIIYILLPALIFRAVSSADFSVGLAIIPMVAVAVALGCVAIAFLIGRALKLKKVIFGSLLLAAGVGNTGYLGYPITQRIFGQTHLVKAIFFDIFGTVLFIFTIGLFIAESYGSGSAKINKLKEIVTFPPLIALAFGYFLRGIILPDFLDSALTYLAAATVPLMMISIGLSLRLGKVRYYIKPLLAVVIIKLAIEPMLAIVLGLSLNLNSTSFLIIILEASMPIAILSLIIGMKYRLDADFLAAAILLTTTLSLITIPFWQQVATSFSR